MEKVQRRAEHQQSDIYRYAGLPRMEFPRNMQKRCQSHYAIQNYTQSGSHQSRLLYLFSDITHVTVIVFHTNPSAYPPTTSNLASSPIQLSFGMLYHLILSLLLLWISLNHRSKPTTTKQSSILYIYIFVHADAQSSQLTEQCMM